MAENGEVTIVGSRRDVWRERSSPPGRLRIDGQVKGQINADGDVTLSPQSQVEADIRAAERQRGRPLQGQHRREGQGAPRARWARRRQHHLEVARRRRGRHLPRAEHHGRGRHGLVVSPVRPARSTAGAPGCRVHDREDRASEGAVAMLDIKAIRDDPETFRKASRGATSRRGRRAARRRRAPSHASPPRVEELRAEQNALEGDRRRAGRREAGADRRASARSARRSRSSSRSWRRRRPSSRGCSRRRRTCRTRAPPTASPMRTRWRSSRSASRRRSTSSRRTTWRSAKRSACSTSSGRPHSGSRFVYLMGDIVFVQFALVRHALDILTEEGFRR